MVFVIPPPLTVTVDDRSEVDVLTSAVTVIVPLLDPEAGETVNQDSEPLLTVQLVFEDMVNVFYSLDDEKLSEEVEIVKFS